MIGNELMLPSALTDKQFRDAMEACLIPGDAFHHRDHIRLAWVYLREAGQAEAARLIRETIHRYAAHHGAARKYHETLTMIWLRLVDSAMRSTPDCDSFDAFAARHPFLFDKETPRRFYSGDLLSSDRARAEWVEPDLARVASRSKDSGSVRAHWRKYSRGRREMYKRVSQSLFAAVLLAAASPSVAQTVAAEGAIVEVRSYNLKPGTRERFHERFVREALPMLQRWRVDVVAYGPSLHDADSYYLIRAFPGVEERQRIEDAFYGSDDWRTGPRDAVLADIESYTTVVVRLDAVTLRGLRRSLASGAGERATAAREGSSADLDVLLALNRDYVRSAQTSDVKRFGDILADDFRCSLADGSFVDKPAFLRLAARPSSVSNLEAHDVEIQFLGDVAIVHARTTFTTADGRAGAGRYTDVWARRDGRWVAVSAHVTRR